MSMSLNSSPLTSFKPLSTNPSTGLIGGSCSATKVVFFKKNTTHNCRIVKLQAVEDKAADESNTEKPVQKVNSLFCPKCEGNGAIVCTQCLGGGINTKDHFDGRFKEGGLCWLCRGKKDILCGECNGAGFLGGFMSTADS